MNYKQSENFNQLQADSRRKTQQIQAMNAETSRMNAETNINRGGTEGERYQIRTGKGLTKEPAPTIDNIENWGATNNVNKTNRSIRKGDDGKVYIVETNNKGERNAKGIISDELLNGDPNVLAQYISTNVYQVPSDYTDFNYNISPIRKLAKFFKRKK